MPVTIRCASNNCVNVVRRQLKRMEGLQPVDPERQKGRALRKYERVLAAATAKFTDNVRERTVNLLKYVSVINWLRI